MGSDLEMGDILSLSIPILHFSIHSSTSYTMKNASFIFKDLIKWRPKGTLMHLLGNNLIYLLLVGGEVFSAVGT